MEISECEGCRSNRGRCLVDNKITCPCKICIIKMVCKDACEEYDRLFDDPIAWYDR